MNPTLNGLRDALGYSVAANGLCEDRANAARMVDRVNLNDHFGADIRESSVGQFPT